MKIFVTSDHHFGHARIIELCKRPFSNVEIMDECLIEYWNSVVSKKDLVIHCGDFALCNAERIHKILVRLNGRKILIKGNHDSRSILFYLDNGFDFVCKYFSLKGIIFTHRPILQWTPKEKIVIHGHIHDKIFENKLATKKYVNVSVEATNYIPKSLDEII